MSFVYAQLVEELKDRWRLETQAALTGWHFAGVMSDEPPSRPELPEWLDVRRAFDEWLVAPGDVPDGVVADDSVLSPEQLDIMIAYGWKEPDDDD